MRCEGFEIKSKAKKSDWNLWSNAAHIVSHTNMAMIDEDKEYILTAAKDVEELSTTGYYDDPDGDLILKQIAFYYRSKAAQLSNN